MLPSYFMYLAALLNLAACGSCFFATLRGKAQPNRATWLMWSLISTITTLAQWKGLGGLSTLVVAASALGPMAVFVASFINPQAYWKTSRLDIMCGVLAAIGLAGWFMTQHPSIAIIFNIFADMAATTPTLLKAWKHPSSEYLPSYILGFLSGLIAIAAIPLPLTFNAAAFVIYIAVSCLAVSTAIIHGRINAISRKEITP